MLPYVLYLFLHRNYLAESLNICSVSFVKTPGVTNIRVIYNIDDANICYSHSLQIQSCQYEGKNLVQIP